MRTITQRELRNLSGEVMRAVDRGESFLVTRNGVPVAELVPHRQRTFVPAEVAIEALRGVSLDGGRLREDLDTVVDQDPTSRA